MKLKDRIKNAVAAFKTADLNDEQLVEWLGIRGVKKKELSEATYFTCLKMLAETVAKLPMKYYQQTEKGKIRAEPDEVYDLLRFRPNPSMTPSTFWVTVENNRNHHGNAFVYIHEEIHLKRYGGYITKELWPMPTLDVSMMIDDIGLFEGRGEMYYIYRDKYSGEQYIFPQEKVMHFKTSCTFDGITGEPVRRILESTIEGGLESQNFMTNLYQNGLTASMVLQFAGDLDDKRRKALAKKYNEELTGAKNAGKIVTVPIGLKLEPLNIKLSDAQFFELKKYSALQIAGAFGIKPNQINNYEKSSYSNSEMQNLSFLVDTMAYILKQYEEEINAKLLAPEKRQQGFYFKFNEKAILRTDSKTQMQNLVSAVQNGLYLVDEAREFLDKPAIPGGDKAIVNGNYIPLEMVGTQWKKGGTGNADGLTDDE
ncbi:phage portal protein [Anaerovorax odorimutans]|uniref:Phage portal protein n=1 Tax=Anaerovorax odorimutans TaxID=109327 RepID=A0ABT1RR53_9FIRM|nr:phage portal protein [Anaerovorax odorimutans]